MGAKTYSGFRSFGHKGLFRCWPLGILCADLQEELPGLFINYHPAFLEQDELPKSHLQEIGISLR